MTKTTFKEVPEVKTVDFCSLVAGDCFYFDNTYHMKLIDDCCRHNAIDLSSGALTFFSLGTKVKPYKNCEVILHE